MGADPRVLAQVGRDSVRDAVGRPPALAVDAFELLDLVRRVDVEL
jgi:hypothetical protein